MSELGKSFLNKSDRKKSENRCQNVACEQKTNSDKLKFGSNKRTRPKMNDEWIGKTIQTKKIRSKKSKKKNSKNQSEIAACEQKTTSEKANFRSNTVFSLYLKIRAKNIHAA